jgi:hypothetical protein
MAPSSWRNESQGPPLPLETMKHPPHGLHRQLGVLFPRISTTSITASVSHQAPRVSAPDGEEFANSWPAESRQRKQPPAVLRCR